MTTVEMKEYWTEDKVRDLVKNSNETLKGLKLLETAYPGKITKLFYCPLSTEDTELECSSYGLSINDIDAVCTKEFPNWLDDDLDTYGKSFSIIDMTGCPSEHLIDITYILEDIRNGRI